jgi:DNA-directed RNA polymerase specialized sigma subunit
MDTEEAKKLAELAPPKVTDIERKTIAVALEAGVSATWLSDEFGISRQRVYQIHQKHYGQRVGERRPPMWRNQHSRQLRYRR